MCEDAFLLFSRLFLESQVHDSSVERSALFEYCLPENTERILLTDKLLFVVTKGENFSMKILANQINEASETNQVG